MQLPTAGLLVDAFNGWILAPIDATSLTLKGCGGLTRKPSSLRLHAVLADGEPVEVEMRLRARLPDAAPRTVASLRDRVAATTVTLHEIHRPQPLRFPLELRVERTRQTIKLEGRRRAFEVFACGDIALATAAVGDLTVDVLAPRSRLGKVALRRLDMRELRQVLKAYRELRGR